MEAKIQALKLCRQHSVATARRVAMETSSTFQPGTPGRAFWLEVMASLEELAGKQPTVPLYQGRALNNQAVNEEKTDEE